MLRINKSDHLPSLLLFWVMFVLALALGMLQLATPEPLSLDADLQEFSAQRAFLHVKQIAQKPHMVGSKEHAKVRAYLLEQLNSLDLDIQEQATTVIYKHPTRSSPVQRFANVHNVLARLPGKNSKLPAIALMSHYDSVPTASGAGDAASGVAAMLETVRALLADSQLERDVILLFTDAEEVGLMGVQAFYREHPWAQDIGLVLNFEARGTSGNVQMFETSNGNSWLIGEFVKAAKMPAANSISYEVYKRMPNDTDVSIIKPANYQVLNFAFVDNAFDYHSPGDIPANLNLGSLQHEGIQALSLVKHFANLQEWRSSSEDKTYFNVFLGKMVHYSSQTAITIGVLVCLLSGLTFVFGVYKKHINLTRVFFACLAICVFIILYLIFAKYLFVFFADRLNRPKNLNYQYHKLLAAGILLSIGLCAAIFQLLNRWLQSNDMVAAAWLMWSVITVIVVKEIPNASYALVWPLFFILLGQISVWNRVNGFWPLALAGLFTWYAWTLLLYMTTLALGLGTPSLMAPFFILVLSQMMLGLLMLSKRTYTVLILGGLGILIFVGLVPNYSERHPLPTEVFYWHDADSNKNYWATHGENKDVWAQQFFKQKEEMLQLYLPRGNNRVLVNDAPAYAVDKADIKLLSKNSNTNSTKIELQILPNEISEMGLIRIASSAKILSAKVNSKPFDLSIGAQTNNVLAIQYFGIGTQVTILELEFESSPQLRVELSEVQRRWPTDMPENQRDKSIGVSNWKFSDSTVITQSVKF